MRIFKFCVTGLALALCAAACGGSSGSGGGGGGGGNPDGGSGNQTGTVNMMLSDSPSEDWATIGVKVLAVALVPQGGGTAVPVYTAPTPAPTINLVQLDELSELLGNISVTPGTYTSAVVTISANPGDVALVVSADPELGFAGTAGSIIASSSIQIQGGTGAAGNLALALTLNLASPLVVTTGASAALNVEFDLGNPAFIIDHVPATGLPTWAVNFNGTLHHHPIKHLHELVLRQAYGSVTAVASTNASLTMTKVYPTRPAVSPETSVASTTSLTIQADATNGTIYYDVDAKTKAVIKDFSTIAATLTGKFVRVTSRYQDDGTLVAVRVWASTSFNNVWLSPEGHVLHVDTTNNFLTVENEDAKGIKLTVDANTEFFFRTPANATAENTPIGTGTAFLANLHRGFKVHASVVDPLANPLVAQTVDIEIAHFEGALSASSATGFTTTRNFATASDDYVATNGYISASTANGEDASGNAVLGFKWWDLTFPTLADTGANAVADFVSATDGSISFGGTAKPLPIWGQSYAVWNDPAAANAWSAAYAILAPQPAPLGTVTTAYASSATGGTISMTVLKGGVTPVVVDISSIAGSAANVYQVDKTAGGVVTVSAIDPTTTAGQAAMTANLTAGAHVKAFGVPEADGSIKAYVLFYYTGIAPLQ